MNRRTILGMSIAALPALAIGGTAPEARPLTQMRPTLSAERPHAYVVRVRWGPGDVLTKVGYGKKTAYFMAEILEVLAREIESQREELFRRGLTKTKQVPSDFREYALFVVPPKTIEIETFAWEGAA